MMIRFPLLLEVFDGVTCKSSFLIALCVSLKISPRRKPVNKLKTIYALSKGEVTLNTSSSSQIPVQSTQDRSLVNTDSSDAAICSATIAMAKGLGIKATAEGVEDERQLAFLSVHPCERIYGLFSDTQSTSLPSVLRPTYSFLTPMTMLRRVLIIRNSLGKKPNFKWNQTE